MCKNHLYVVGSKTINYMIFYLNKDKLSNLTR